MCSCTDFCRPITACVVTIRHCHDHGSWVGATSVTSTATDGQVIDQGAASKQFGPFDGYTEVGHWLASQTKVLRAMSDPAMMEKIEGWVEVELPLE